MVPGPKLAKADSGTMVSTRVETEAPVEEPPRAPCGHGIELLVAHRIGGDRLRYRWRSAAGCRVVGVVDAAAPLPALDEAWRRQRRRPPPRWTGCR